MSEAANRIFEQYPELKNLSLTISIEPSAKGVIAAVSLGAGCVMGVGHSIRVYVE